MPTPKETADTPEKIAREPMKDISVRSSVPMTKDRVLLAVSNPYWLHAYWELSPHSVQRAEAALRQDWHGARMIIRLFDVTSQDTTSTSETPVKDIIIHGPGQNWYIDVPQPPRMYRADIGYVSRRGEFYVLARSNVVTPPKAGTAEPGTDIEAGWGHNDAKWKAERILAMSTGFESTGSPERRELFEERLGRPFEGAPKTIKESVDKKTAADLKKMLEEAGAKVVVKPAGERPPTPRKQAKPGMPRKKVNPAPARSASAADAPAPAPADDLRSVAFRAALLAHFRTARDKAISNLARPEG